MATRGGGEKKKEKKKKKDEKKKKSCHGIWILCAGESHGGDY